jgi:hypothetical protein
MKYQGLKHHALNMWSSDGAKASFRACVEVAVSHPDNFNLAKQIPYFYLVRYLTALRVGRFRI